MQHLVSIILPNYNHEQYLDERLKSIFNQTYQNFEVIILDDASTDSSLSILNKYKNHPKVSHFIVNEVNNGSPFKQWQIGLARTKGEYIWIAESDDYCELNFLESQIKCLELADVAVAKTIAFNSENRKNQVAHPIFNSFKKDDAILYCPILNVSAVLFKAQLLSAVNSNYYINFKMIGDRVFYFEYFNDASIVFNVHTANYFRQSKTSISKLDKRDLVYYKSYFDEHYKFIIYAQKIDSDISKQTIKRYIEKFYMRVSNRVEKKHKRGIQFLHFYIIYKFRLLVSA